MPLFGHRRYGRRRGGGLRLIIALAIALFGLIAYYTGTQENPITGEPQRVGGILPADEVAIGYNTMPQLVSQMGGAVPESDPRAQRVQQIGRRLVEASGVGKGPYEFTFTLLDDPTTINAFALPGGPVFITVALYERLENEAQLAGVLGHEIGHVVHRHGAQRMAKAQLAGTLTLAAGVGAADERGGAAMAAATAALAGQVIMMRYGREEELQSDDQGLSYMISTGYDPREMLHVMKVLRDASGDGGRGPNFLQSHPHPDARMDAIRRFIETTYPSGVPPNLTKGASLR
jgi:beta-barrel assembly-enhancing protease